MHKLVLYASDYLHSKNKHLTPIIQWHSFYPITGSTPTIHQPLCHKPTSPPLPTLPPPPLLRSTPSPSLLIPTSLLPSPFPSPIPLFLSNPPHTSLFLRPPQIPTPASPPPPLQHLRPTYMTITAIISILSPPAMRHRKRGWQMWREKWSGQQS